MEDDAQSMAVSRQSKRKGMAGSSHGWNHITSRPKLSGTYEGKILDLSRESPVLDKKDVLNRCPA